MAENKEGELAIWESVKILEDKLKKLSEGRDLVRATMLLNVGPDGRDAAGIGPLCNSSMGTSQMVVAVFTRLIEELKLRENRIETLTRYVNDGGERERKLIDVIRDIIEMPTKSPGEQEIAWNNAVEILKTVQEDYNVPQYPDRYFRPEDYDPSQSQIPLGGCSAAFPDDDEAKKG